MSAKTKCLIGWAVCMLLTFVLIWGVASYQGCIYPHRLAIAGTAFLAFCTFIGVWCNDWDMIEHNRNFPVGVIVSYKGKQWKVERNCRVVYNPWADIQEGMSDLYFPMLLLQELEPPHYQVLLEPEDEDYNTVTRLGNERDPLQL
jgi:hypothetical protein